MVNNRKNVNNVHDDGLITVKEVAFLVHVHPNTVRRWSDNGFLKSYRISNRGDRKFKLEDINRVLAIMS